MTKKKSELEFESENVKAYVQQIQAENGILAQQLDQLKAENDTLRQFLSKEPLALQALQSGYASYKKSADVFYEMVKQYKQTLTEIKPILEFYANSKMGEEQPDRTYKIMLSGGYIMVYDPKPARQALQKISEVEMFKEIGKMLGDLQIENDKLKQTFTEIKEIAEKNLNIHTCAFKGCGYDLITKQILQKISEVEDE